MRSYAPSHTRKQNRLHQINLAIKRIFKLKETWNRLTKTQNKQGKDGAARNAIYTFGGGETGKSIYLLWNIEGKAAESVR
jgi:hypothetical protein